MRVRTLGRTDSIRYEGIGRDDARNGCVAEGHVYVAIGDGKVEHHAALEARDQLCQQCAVDAVDLQRGGAVDVLAGELTDELRRILMRVSSAGAVHRKSTGRSPILTNTDAVDKQRSISETGC